MPISEDPSRNAKPQRGESGSAADLPMRELRGFRGMKGKWMLLRGQRFGWNVTTALGELALIY